MNGRLVVEDVQADDYGGAVVVLSGDSVWYCFQKGRRGKIGDCSSPKRILRTW